MYSTKQNVPTVMQSYEDAKDQADAAKILTMKSTESPLLQYQANLVNSRA
jgi:hypothetical protein